MEQMTPEFKRVLTDLLDAIDDDESAISMIGPDDLINEPNLFKYQKEYHAAMMRMMLTGKVAFKGKSYTTAKELDDGIRTYIGRYDE